MTGWVFLTGCVLCDLGCGCVLLVVCFVCVDHVAFLVDTGFDFLTVLGAHEGEGLVVDTQMQVTGSRDVEDRGHQV